ncbi:MAG TPA: aromatic ring-hydroxylating dioxygenase subunit alpha [Vicinamibacterales bacterium]|jgi:Rieske 2Fe-2S family protein|nr:aromatic ring-hydroxylating dioxygenase subunit alpha [Vicinamibacterales bacterium]
MNAAMHDTGIVGKPRDVLPGNALTLPAEYYVSGEYFARELDLLFRRTWICAGRSEEVARAGQFVVRELPGDNMVITRSESGDLHAFHNVCRHRGTRLCTAPSGTFPGSIQCPYHAWTYALDGRLLGAPHMEDVPHFNKQDYPLHRVHVDDWDGHLFINLADRPAPLAEQLADLPSKFAPWRMSELRVGQRIVYDVKANWKLIIQNYNECLHCPNLHPALNKLSHYLSGENEPLQPTYMGGRMDLRPGVATLSMDGSCPRAFLPELSSEDRRRVYYYAIFPNMLLSLHPDYMMVHTLWPIAPDRTINVCEWHFHPTELHRPDFDASDAIELWDVTNRQDWHVCELSQAGIGSRSYRPGPYSNREDLLYAFDRMIVELHRR